MHEDHAIAVVSTPNPDARMFRVEETLVPAGTFSFSNLDQAADAPLGQALLKVSGVDLILVAPRFVTVRKQTDAGWEALQPTVLAALREFLASGDMAVLTTAADNAGDADPASDLERRVLEVLEDEIRPALAQDGGDVELVGIVDEIVQLRLVGACDSCPSSASTLRFGIERLLLEEFPELRGVEQVA
jgi:NFU1 iron-sulfur cluster scaffold homolog, mitochondrial